jgi:RNA exonuclease 4
MAVYRLHRREWDKGLRPPPVVVTKGKRKRSCESADGGVGVNEAEAKESTSKPVSGGKGVSTGLSTVMRWGGMGGGKQVLATGRKLSGSRSVGEKPKWWKELGGVTSKGSMKLNMR